MKFGKVSKDVLSDPNITHGAKSLYALLCCYMDQDRTCYPGIDRLSTEMNVGQSTIKRWLSELKQAKVIDRAVRGFRNSYTTIILK
jgi:hypothetical protein